MKKILLSFLLLACLLLTGPALAAPAPKLSIAKLEQLPILTMRPYDEAANADVQVAAAFARAQKSQKRVLIDLGGNWCPDCIVLTNLMKLPQMRRFMDRHYELVMVDVGRFNRNLQIPARFGIAKLRGVPALLIATPGGTLINKDNVFATTDARNMTPQAIADYLAKYAN
ncbi:MAG TPA: thioredoxin family protein [Rhizomicrobium sp.]|nr:thioredoxin family protein [Rhizomicrobium sp.]